MQHAGRQGLGRYHNYLQSDHDFRVWVDVINIDETSHVATLELLDGQVNYALGEDGPDRTASLTISDPGGALHFGLDYLEDPKGILWINRLIQVWHEVTVPDYGDWRTSCGVFLPTAVSRSGGEVGLELGDKSLLSDHGVRPKTFKKGMNVRSALVSVLRDCTGERRFNIPTTKKRLSRSYTVGMGEDAVTPWQCFQRIAAQEMGWRAYYNGLGFATCEPTSAASNPVQVHSLLSLPDASASFTDFSNYSRVTSHRKPNPGKKASKKKKEKAKRTTIIHDSIVALPVDNPLSEQKLARNTVPRTLPIVQINDDLKSLQDTLDQATKTLKANSGIDAERSFDIIPMFHLEPHEKVRLPEVAGNLEVTLAATSIPLCTGGSMTIGTHRWVSRPVKVRRLKKKTDTHIRKKKKGGKKS